MDAKWYIVHAYSNFEDKVAKAIRDQAERQNIADQFHDIKVPTEEVVESVRGKKRVVPRRYFPGYVLVKMEMSDEAHALIKNTPKVTGFLGSGDKPVPVPEKEIDRILGVAQQAADKPRTITFETGEQVKVVDGPFASFSGLVEEVDDARGRLKVAVSIFGRETPVDLAFSEVEKVR
jgi:transcription termination/antitermination protein NusG